MPVTADKPAPYAPASAILSLIERHRNKGLPSTVDAEVLARAGVSDSLVPRTLYALSALDLITDDGSPSPVLEGIRLAPESEYRQRITEWLNSSYADALAYIDPATATEGDIRDAFRTYKPIGQQSRMVTLFQGLYAAAGIAPERQRQAPKRNGSAPPPKPKAKPLTASLASHTPARAFANSAPRDGLPPALAGLLASLPSDGRWTQAQRDKFMTAFPVMLDYAFEVVEETAETKTAFDL